MLRSVLLLFVAIAGPWIVHLAPMRQRLMALAGFIGVLLLWLAFVENWFGKWWFWVGLIAGVASVLFVGGGQPRNRRPPPRSRRPRPTDMTEEFGPPVSR
jgi:1,4-dihydroxy-2-naphthoate octaprenyltransferase